MIGWDYVHYYDVVANGIDNNITLRGEYLTVFLLMLLDILILLFLFLY